MEEMNLYYRSNLFHVICLNSVFKSMFPKSQFVFINISSILGIQCQVTWAFYCSVKAARYIIFFLFFSSIFHNFRDAMFRVLALEQPESIVMTYYPGLLNNSMILEILQDCRTDKGKYFNMKQCQLSWPNLPKHDTYQCFLLFFNAI